MNQQRFRIFGLFVAALVALVVTAPARAQQTNLNIPGNAAVAGTAIGRAFSAADGSEIVVGAAPAINNVIGHGEPGTATFLDMHHFVYAGVPGDAVGPWQLDLTLPAVLDLTTLQAYVCEGSDNGFVDADRNISSVEFFVDQGSGFVSVGSVAAVDTDDIGCFDLVELAGVWSGVNAVRYEFTPKAGTNTPLRIGEVAAISPSWAPLYLTGGIELIEEGGTIEENNLAAGAVPFAYDELGYGAHLIAHINDGVFGNSNSWIGASAPPGGAYVGLALPELTSVGSIAFGRDNLGGFTDRWQGTYTLQYTQAADPPAATDADWTTIGTLTYNTAEPPLFARPSVRHQYTFDAVEATGIRLMVPAAGLGNGTCIDELELYASAEVVVGYELTGGITLVAEGGGIREGNVALASTGAEAFAIDSIEGYSAHSIAHLNDGLYGNDHSWIGVSVSPTLEKGFAGIDFNALCEIDGIAFGRDNTGNFFERFAGEYTLQYTLASNPDETTPDSEWIDIGTITYTGPGGDNFSNPAVRHEFSFDPVLATGIRLVVPYVQNTGAGTCLDELEVYGIVIPEPNTVLLLLGGLWMLLGIRRR